MIYFLFSYMAITRISYAMYHVFYTLFKIDFIIFVNSYIYGNVLHAICNLFIYSFIHI